MARQARSERLIQRRDHSYFHGWVVAAKRGGKRWARYFSDKPGGSAIALRQARAYREKLVRQLPWPTKVKRSYVLNTTGVMGIARIGEHSRAGTLLWRYVAQWPTREGRYLKATFSVRKYGEKEARRMAVEARRKGLAGLMGNAPRTSRA